MFQHHLDVLRHTGIDSPWRVRTRDDRVGQAAQDIQFLRFQEATRLRLCFASGQNCGEHTGCQCRTHASFHKIRTILAPFPLSRTACCDLMHVPRGAE